MDYREKLMNLLDDLYKGNLFKLDVAYLSSKEGIKNSLLLKAATRQFFKDKGYILKNKDITIYNKKEIWIELSKSGKDKFKIFEKQYPEYFI